MRNELNEGAKFLLMTRKFELNPPDYPSVNAIILRKCRVSYVGEVSQKRKSNFHRGVRNTAPKTSNNLYCAAKVQKLATFMMQYHVIYCLQLVLLLEEPKLIQYCFEATGSSQNTMGTWIALNLSF